MKKMSYRKRFALGLGLLLLAGIGLMAWPLIVGPDRMQDFCSALTVGQPLSSIQAQAAQHGYRMSPEHDGHAIVFDSAAFGRFTCSLQFGVDGLTSAVYVFND